MQPRRDDNFLLPTLMATYIAESTLYDHRRDEKPAPRPLTDPDDIPEDMYEAMAGSFRPDMGKDPHQNPFSFI